MLPIVGSIRPALGAERIKIVAGAFEISIPIKALQIYAKTGKINASLAPYVKRLKPQQLTQLRQTLVKQIDLSPVAISQFFYSPIGETILARIGELIQTNSGLSGYYALRAALILSAADPQGLTLLNVLQKFPSNAIRLDIPRILQTKETLNKLQDITHQAVTLISERFAATARKETINLSQILSLEQRGQFSWNKQTLMFDDPRNSRQFLADIYLPQVKTKVPIIVISYGLGEDRSTFAYLAEQLASYGFAVAIPENPSSNAQQLQDLLNGLSNKVSPASAFVNRALDVQFLLDELQRRSQFDPTLPIDTQQAGIIGQSFGGYTALALAGAPFNFQQLQKSCTTLNDTLNLSLLLQCQALKLPQIPYNFRDPRIKAAIVINPVDSSIFGRDSLSKIQIPIMVVSGSADFVAPALLEQIVPFSWLRAKEKYLVVLKGGTHFSTTSKNNAQQYPLATPSQFIGPDPALARQYVKALSVAFCQTYVAGARKYLPYLSASSIQVLSQPPLPLSIVQSLDTAQLVQVLKRTKDILPPSSKD